MFEGGLDDTNLPLRINAASIRRAPEVSEQPLVRLLQWRLVCLPSSDKLLVGCVEGSAAVRITTAVVRTLGRQAWTTSGRQYDLRYAPALSAESLAMLRERLFASGLYFWVDVTEAFIDGALPSGT
jgi:hypothetical protein